MSGDIQNTANGNGGITQVVQQNYYGNPSGTYYLHTTDGRVWFETTGRGFPIKFDKNVAPVEEYFYETRSNLTRVTYNDPNGTGYQIVAEYPATCTNRKICNQATRIRDANGNWTDYTYHPDSGQVASITYPANKEGLRAQTRFYYAKKKAAYFNRLNVFETVADEEAIWLKTAEEYCINSAASGGGCQAGDEVVTTYEYKHPNLLMTGMVVTSPDGVRRTCYQYDDFGNQIGVTTPLGNSTVNECPGPGVTP
jgi:YD repeat-containing protein